MIRLFSISFLISLSLEIYPQNQIDTVYNFELSASASPVISFFRDERYPDAPHNSSFGYSIYLKALWHPGKLFAVGILSGYLFLVQDEIENIPQNNFIIHNSAVARLNAIPLQVVVSMQKRGLEIGLGMGPYLLLSTIEQGISAKGYRYELGLTLYGSYVLPVGKKIFIGPELKLLYLSYRGIFSVMPSITARIDLWSY
jgi:hypothetical protein